MLEPFALLFMTVNSFKRQSDQNFICQLGRPERKVILPRGCYDVTAGMLGGGGGGERETVGMPAPSLWVLQPATASQCPVQKECGFRGAGTQCLGQPSHMGGPYSV